MIIKPATSEWATRQSANVIQKNEFAFEEEEEKKSFGDIGYDTKMVGQRHWSWSVSCCMTTSLHKYGGIGSWSECVGNMEVQSGWQVKSKMEVLSNGGC